MEWLNYHHLHYFWVVVREGSIARASALSYVSWDGRMSGDCSKRKIPNFIVNLQFAVGIA